MNPYQSPSQAERNNVAPARSTSSLLPTIALVVAAVLWTVYFLQGMPLVGVAVYSGFTVIPGLLGHVCYQKVVQSRFTVVCTVVLIFNIIPAALSLSAPLNAFDFLMEWNLLPFNMFGILSRRTVPAIMFLCFALILLLAPAHIIRPSIQTAVLSSLGIGMWYGTALLFVMHAG